MVDHSTVGTLVTKARRRLAVGGDKHAARVHTDAAHSAHGLEIEALQKSAEGQGSTPTGMAPPSGRATQMNDLVITRQFVERAEPETLRAELLRYIDDGVRAIHISLTLPLREPVRCIARTDALDPGRRSSATASTPPR